MESVYDNPKLKIKTQKALTLWFLFIFDDNVNSLASFEVNF